MLRFRYYTRDGILDIDIYIYIGLRNDIYSECIFKVLCIFDIYFKISGDDPFEIQLPAHLNFYIATSRGSVYDNIIISIERRASLSKGKQTEIQQFTDHYPPRIHASHGFHIYVYISGN